MATSSKSKQSNAAQPDPAPRDSAMHIIASIILIALAFWLVSWLIVGVGMA